MFPITLSLTIHNQAQLAQVGALFAGAGSAIGGVSAEEKAAVASITSPSATDDFPEPGMEAPGKPSAAPTARSPRTAAAAPSTPAPSAAVPEPKAETPAAQPTAAPAAAPSAPSPAPADTTGTFDYAVLQKAVNARVVKHKAALLAIATKHGAANFKALAADKWQAAYDDVVALEV